MTDPDPTRRHDQEEPDQDDVIAALADHAGQLPPAPVVVRGPNADRDRLTREAMATAGERGVFFIPDELGPFHRQEYEGTWTDDDAEPLEDAEARQAAARAGLDPLPLVAPGTVVDPVAVVGLVGDLIDNMSSVSPGAADFLVDVSWANALVSAVTGEDMDLLGEDDEDPPLRYPRTDIVDDQGRIVQVIDGREASDHGTDDGADLGPELGEGPDDGYPTYPCPKDSDGLHYPGCGCEHY